MRKSILIMAILASLIVASLAFTSADEPAYKNLKILKKNITKKEMDSVMHFFSVSLGEKCGFCHARNEAAKSIDFASDANPNKNVARSMMRMTTKINKKYFKNEENKNSQTIQAVSCYTCHHGQGHPAVKPSAMQRENMGNLPGDRRSSAGNAQGDAQRDSSRSLPADSH